MPEQRPLRFAVIGAGMAGILSAIKLREAGCDDFTLYEKGDGFGGTWRENTYPGLSCDVPSHLYSYSFALTPEWSRRFSPGPEIRQYFEQVALDHGVDRRTCFNEEVVQCEWSDGRWRLETGAGLRDEADVVIAATGVLHHPNLPDFPGMDSFAGASFHSSRWDHSVALDGQRVGVIGTGSTAIQITSALVPRVAKYSLFQRTPQWIFHQDNPEHTDDEKAVFRDDPGQLRELHDRLAEMFGLFANGIIDADSPEMQMIEEACRINLETKVRDPELRERLRPDYRAACKRLIMSADFYEAIQAPNADLVTEKIQGIEPEGVRTVDGRLHELDVLVYATGFKADAFMRPMEVIGRDGATLSEEWSQRPTAYLSLSMPGFPNFFMLNGPNGPVGNFSLIEVAELQFGYVLQLLDPLRRGDAREVAPKREVMEAFEEARVEAAKNTIWVTGCRSWYLDDRGIPATWPWPFDRFREEMQTPDPDAYDYR